MNPEHPRSCSALRGTAGLEGATGEGGADGFQPRLEEKWREMDVAAACVRATGTVPTSAGPAVPKGTDALREILGFSEGLERLSALQTLSWFQERVGRWGLTPPLQRPPVPQGALPPLQPQPGLSGDSPALGDTSPIPCLLTGPLPKWGR